MVCQPLRLALLIGAITAVAVSPLRANGADCNSCGSSPTTPAFRTVTCTEWVKESYTTKRKAYKVECRTETYNTCRIECVPECQEKVICVKKRVPVMTEECRKVCHKVTVWEERIVNKTSYKYEQHTCTKKTLVRLGHWECKEVPALFNGFSGGLFSGHGCGNSCGTCSTGCNDSCNTCAAPCRTRTVKHWVHCPEYKECPVTVCKKVPVCEAVKCKVAVCKNVWVEEKVKVCTYQCVEEKQTVKCTVYVKRSVPCKATRTVRVCVPYEVDVTCCKMVPRTVTRQVACAPACTNSCGTSCNTCNSCCEREGLFSRLRDRLRHNGDCCRSSCSSCN